MMNSEQTPPEPGATSLMIDVIADTYTLALQQYALLRYELAGILSAYREAGRLIAFGGASITLGSVLVCFMAVYFLSWIFPELPLWLCFGIVGTPIVAAGAALLYKGSEKLKRAHKLCDQSQKTLKETLAWATTLKTRAGK
jgi:hypothetical protein